MIDNSNNLDIINLSVRSTDFLCQNAPLVCAVEPYRSSDRRRTRGFLLEDIMPKGLKGFQKGHPRFTTKGDFKKGSIPWNKGKKLPEMCGKNHPNWKGGRDVSHGYIRLQVNGRVILEHRLIMMNKLGRNLKKTECIHHINGIKTDNRIENLKVVKRAEHLIKFHPHSFRGGSEIRICLICKKEFKTFLSNNNHYCGRKCFDKRGLLRKEKTNEKV